MSRIAAAALTAAVCLCVLHVSEGAVRAPVSSPGQPVYPWFNLTIPRSDRLSLLVAAMSVSDKVGGASGCNTHWPPPPLSPPAAATMFRL